MANIGTFTTLNDKGTANAPDFRILTSGGVEIGAAWKKLSQNDRPQPVGHAR